jgi:hypothetical protein
VGALPPVGVLVRVLVLVLVRRRGRFRRCPV